MDEIVPTWKPTTLDEAHLASNVSIALREIAGRHLLPNEVHDFIGRALLRTEGSVRLRFHAQIIEHFDLKPIKDRDKIESALELIVELEEDRRKK